MSSKSKIDLASTARAIFDEILNSIDPQRAVENAVEAGEEKLKIGAAEFDLSEDSGIYSIAFGKAAFAMARGLETSVHDRLGSGVISAPQEAKESLSNAWRRFAGGHPVPNEESLAAGRAAVELLRNADAADNIVIFLVSGGGSAMLELPADPGISLSDLRTTNAALVNCGAKIAEVNGIRRRLSAIKGGGLVNVLNRARHFTLIVSDTNEDEAFNVASGPTLRPPQDLSVAEIDEVIERYGLRNQLPASVLEFLKQRSEEFEATDVHSDQATVVLSNRDAVEATADASRRRGFVVEIADDVVEDQIESGCRLLLDRLTLLRGQTPLGKPVAVVSGGEFVCPVRGDGRGGRNSESALRTAMLIDDPNIDFRQNGFAALFAGTDGIDGNSPAAGATCDSDTLKRARNLGLDADEYLANSDSYNFFARLGDAIEIGPTGTNVRDIRILLAD